MHLRVIILAAIAVSFGTAYGLERDRLPLGHPEFYPSPERPVGWRGDGNGAFPGATMVERFGDGPFGHKLATQGKKKGRKIAYAKGDDPINIAWKYELPGFTYAQPIIVGNRAIQTCEPRTILCIDMQSGEKLWSQELCPFTMIGLQGQQRESGLYLESAVWTLKAIQFSKFGNYNRLPGKDAAQKWAAGKKVLAQISGVLDKMEAHYPDLTARARSDLDKARSILDGPPIDDKGKKGATPAKQIVGYLGAPGKMFAKAFRQRFSFPSESYWYSYVGWTWPTPVCDGTWLYVFMNQGQIARLSLEDGSISWFRQLTEIRRPLKQPLPRSPILHDGILYMLADDALYALDPETGNEIWTVKKAKGKDQVMKWNSCISAVGLRMVHLPSGRSVLAHAVGGDVNALYLLDPKSGELLWKWEPQMKGRCEPGPSLMSEGDIILFGNNSSAWRVTDAGGQVTATQLWQHKKRWQANVQVLQDGLWYSSHDSKYSFNIYDLQTGKATLPGEGLGGKEFSTKVSSYRPGIIVGDYLVVAPSHRGTMRFKDHTHYAQEFVICAKDGSAVVSRNILQFIGRYDTDGLPVRAPQADPFLSESLKSTDLGNLCVGIPNTFGWGGAFAHGNRLLIPSVKHLYCIGDPAQAYTGKAK